jgi:hypothetical protein
VCYHNSRRIKKSSTVCTYIFIKKFSLFLESSHESSPVNLKFCFSEFIWTHYDILHIFSYFQFSLSSWHYLPIRHIFCPQPPLLKMFQSVYFSWCWRQSYTPLQYVDKYTLILSQCAYYTIIYMERQNNWLKLDKEFSDSVWCSIRVNVSMICHFNS